jgi:N-acetyl-gamma-glutamyl-phosphate reductase
VLEQPEAEGGADVDAAIVAYPHGAAAPVVAALRSRGTKVVDLSADFRLHDLQTYSHWYGEHGAPELLGDAVYGLTELHREAIAAADLVANPGCYPTAALLGLAPLARAGVIGDVVIDAKSGVSGAGRAATASTHFIAADENVSPYKIEGHRHTPEIEQELAALGAELTITFTPHLLPLAQGELVSCYVTPARELGEGELAGLYDDAYAAEPFVELRDGPVGVIDVRDTNYCRISVLQDQRTGRVIVFSAIDNLWKGAASQAVQNLNLMFGVPETQGLL